ncbi:MAG: hypothetical protein U0Q22_14295 [Acidimicrobiales bacterium]
MTISHHHDVVDAPGAVTTSSAASHRFSPGQLLGGAVGAVMVVFGIIAVTRTGIDGRLNEPVTSIAGITHSAYVGMFELLIGLLLLISASSIAYRGVMGVLGALTVIGGVVLVAGNLRVLLEVGARANTGWFMVVLGAAAVLGSMMPSFVRTERRVEQHLD